MKSSLVVIVISACLAGCNVSDKQSSTQPSTLANVVKQGVLRCGYVNYPPGLIKDPNSGKITGVFAEAVQEIAARANLKVEWAEEVGWGTMIESLQQRRFDMICSPVWANVSRAKFAIFSQPLFYSGIGIYVRANDNRFDNGFASLNDSSKTIATIDGELSDTIRSEDFPEAKKLALPQLSDNSQMLLNVVSGKADATFVEPYIANAYLTKNPGTLKNVAYRQPIRIFPTDWMFRPEDESLRQFFDVGLEELSNSGELEKIIKRYEKSSLDFYRRALTYQPMAAN